MIYPALKAALGPALDRDLDWTIEGVEHIPERDPVLLGANHISHSDALCIAYAAAQRGRRTRCLARGDLFSVPVLGTILRGVGDIPVGRGKGTPESTFAAAQEALAAGWCLAMFPEGRISRDLEPLTARTGVARLAQSAGVPVVPIGLWGTHRIWAKGRVPRMRPGVAQVIAVGAPLAVEAGEEARPAADRIMAAICTQVARARELYPQRPAPGETAWWDAGPDTPRLRECRRVGEDAPR